VTFTMKILVQFLAGRMGNFLLSFSNLEALNVWALIFPMSLDRYLQRGKVNGA